MEELKILNEIIKGIMAVSIASIVWIITSHIFTPYGAMIILGTLALWAYILHKAYKHLERI